MRLTIILGLAAVAAIATAACDRQVHSADPNGRARCFEHHTGVALDLVLVPRSIRNAVAVVADRKMLAS